jgi:hypothetical protein
LHITFRKMVKTGVLSGNRTFRNFGWSHKFNRVGLPDQTPDARSVP